MSKIQPQSIVVVFAVLGAVLVIIVGIDSLIDIVGVITKGDLKAITNEVLWHTGRATIIYMVYKSVINGIKWTIDNFRRG